MEPISLIVTALVAGAVAAAKGVGAQAVKDGYTGLKSLLTRKFGDKGGVKAALELAETKPESEACQGALKEVLTGAEAGQDEELVRKAQTFLDLLKAHDAVSADVYQATVSGSGAVAQGSGAVAAGKGGVAVGGNLHGGVNTDEDRER